MIRKAVVLLSGGLDSTTCLAIARDEGYQPYALTINYGQHHNFELKAAQRVVQFFHIENHCILDINLAQFGGSALTADIEIPKNRNENEIKDIPPTYVPARNTVLLSLALAWAETLDTYDIFIGVNAIDYSGYPDCRPEYISSFEKTANLATKAGISGTKFKIHTPLITLTKSEIIKLGLSKGVNYGLTSTCYDPKPNGDPCSCCDACFLRLKGFNDANVDDPLNYTST